MALPCLPASLLFCVLATTVLQSCMHTTPAVHKYALGIGRMVAPLLGSPGLLFVQRLRRRHWRLGGVQGQGERRTRVPALHHGSGGAGGDPGEGERTGKD